MSNQTHTPNKPDDACPHPGPRERGRREAAALSLSATAYKTRVDIGKLSKFERAIGDLTLDERRRLDAVLATALLDRAQALETALAQETAVRFQNSDGAKHSISSGGEPSARRELGQGASAAPGPNSLTELDGKKAVHQINRST